ncbi:hypothetical protein MAM1_0900d11347 [Mucor ambiguus]|uniref:Uncharacterized protein n=1 Tax=Mucor ambiguus TaxID=91626 RepID=A0A0C9MLY7_9FUNG|nr:hypothetical protein MAM1_0900d11347 [Mucor ambiguus]
MMLSLGVCCCCDCRSLAVLAILSFGNLVLASAACCRSLAVLMLLVQLTAVVAVYLLLSSWCGLGACFCCLLSSICCLGAVYCYCCCSFTIAVLVMHSHGVRVCCCCRSFAVLAMLYRVNLVLFAAICCYYKHLLLLTAVLGLASAAAVAHLLCW